MSAILTQKLTKTYGSARGVSEIDLQVKEGEVFGFVGPNGAGKSTTIRMIMQLIKPTSGGIQLLGQQIEGERPDLRRFIGYLPSEVHLYRDLSGRDLLGLTARAYGLDLTATRAFEYAERLQYNMDQSVKSYSLGNRKKLGIIIALLHEPKLLILDEPTSGLDPLMQQSFFDILKEKNESGMTIFFSTHVLAEVEKICHRVAMIREGRIVSNSNVEQIAGRNHRIVHVQFEEPGNRIDAFSLRQIDPEVTFDGRQHTFTVHGPIHETLHRLSMHPIADIVIEKPSLEQLFMQHYRKEGERS